MVRIGHASLGSNGLVKGDKIGDQGKEVTIREWYAKSWNILLRPKDPIKAEKMAQSCEIVCNNQNCGYDQSTRNSLRQEAIKHNFNLSKIGLCNCDCSSFMSVCAESANIPIPYNYGNAPTTRTMRTAFMSTGEFDLLTDSIYLTSPNFLKRGDILVKENSHTVMVLDNGSLAENIGVKYTGTFAVDISANQGDINFGQLKNSGVSKIILRTTTKNLQPDTKWYEYLNSCDKYGIPVECYKYSYATTVQQSITEANSVLQLLNGRKMFIWLDLENKEQRTLIQKQGITQIANAFIAACNNVGYEVGIYCNLDWYKNCIDDSFKTKYKFWIARYPKVDTGLMRTDLKPNIGEVMWQFTSKGQISGINGVVDIDAIYDTNKPIQSQIEGSTCVTEGIQIKNTVSASILNVRQFPIIYAPIVNKLSRGTNISIFGYMNGWYMIDKNMSQWVSAEYIQTTQARVIADKLNYREDAGTISKLLGQFTNGDIVKVLNTKNYGDTPWYLCLGDNEKFGWVSGKYIESI